MRFDLQRILHLDLNEWLRGERDWLELFESLPYLRATQGSALDEAQMMDRELAELAADGPKGSGEPRIFGYGAVESRLDNIADLLALVVKVQPGVEVSIPPSPRPVPEVELVRLERQGLSPEQRRGGLDSMKAKLFGDRW